MDAMLVRCWASVVDAGPTSNQHWAGSSTVFMFCSAMHLNRIIIYLSASIWIHETQVWVLRFREALHNYLIQSRCSCYQREDGDMHTAP